MPRARFANLPTERRVGLLEAAAHEFAARGYDDASLNQILERAGVSKGVAYYYFEDKEDLFLTVVQYYMDQLGVGNFEELPETVTPETFWPELAELYRKPFVRSREYPWSFGVWRAAREVFRSAPHARLTGFVNQYLGVLARLLKRGQDLGVVRTDLPDDLLMGWVLAIDDANDLWILNNWKTLDEEALSGAADRVVDGLRRLIGTHGC